ncbi:GatB/YqeY domain-containing protein [Candidatus Saccharibacteria bacterium]|nr:GatB/YqeY domain-containing protein [Candidatus Saccharibacteria bacterium]
MDLTQQLESDLVVAMKLRDEVRTTTLRLLKSSLKNYQIELGRDLTMQESLSVLQKEAKKHQDSINQFGAANRQDLVSEEQAELDIIEKYLPAQMSETDVSKAVDSAITELGASSMADMGKVIGHVRQKTAGQADGGLIAQLAKQKLS